MMKTLRHQASYLLFCVLSLATFSACDSCNADDLPVLQIDLSAAASQAYVISGHLIEETQLLPGQGVALPFALNQDCVTYRITNLHGQQEIVALGYVRKSAFEDNSCGFYLKIEKLVLLPQTTISNVTLHNEGSTWFVDIAE